jgi:hypothetical protein
MHGNALRKFIIILKTNANTFVLEKHLTVFLQIQDKNFTALILFFQIFNSAYHHFHSLRLDVFYIENLEVRVYIVTIYSEGLVSPIFHKSIESKFAKDVP